MVTITRRCFINIFQTLNFLAVKFHLDYKKNMSFLMIPKSPKVGKKLKRLDWSSLRYQKFVNLVETKWKLSCKLVLCCFLKDSYLLDYFDALATDLRVGPPVYFVTTDGYDFTNRTAQNKICGGAGCNDDSLTQQIFYASAISE